MMPLDATPNYFPISVNTQWSSVSTFFEGRSWLRSAQEKLEELSKLPENWNSYGSRPIQSGAIETAANLLSDLIKINMPEPKIFPVSGGGIQLEWENSKCEFELEIMPDKSIEYLIVDEKGEMHEGKLPRYNKLIDVIPLTNWFIKEKNTINDISNIYAPSF
jgi:hypothetical protein